MKHVYMCPYIDSYGAVLSFRLRYLFGGSDGVLTSAVPLGKGHRLTKDVL